MATLVYTDPDDEINGSRQGLTFSKTQAGNAVKRKPSPINPQPTPRMKNRLIVRESYEFFKNLNAGQKNLWTTFAAMSGITGPNGRGGVNAAFAAFISCAINNRSAGDAYPSVPGPPVPIAGPNFSALVLLDEDTARATFNPSPTGLQKHIYLRQALPGPGVRRWDQANGYIAEFSPHNSNSPFDFNLKFTHKTGWTGRYWLGFQNEFGGRAIETQFDIAS